MPAADFLLSRAVEIYDTAATSGRDVVATFSDFRDKYYDDIVVIVLRAGFEAIKAKAEKEKLSNIKYRNTWTGTSYGGMSLENALATAKARGMMLSEAEIKQRKKYDADRVRIEAKAKRRSETADANFSKVCTTLRAAIDLYDAWTLSDGTRLGDATRSQLLAEASMNRAVAIGHMRNFHFYSKLADLVPDGSCVRDAVSAETTDRLRQSVYVGTKAA